MSPDALPGWLRTLDALASGTYRVARLAAAIRDETAIAWTPPERRPRLTAALFDRAPTYAPGGAMYALGLHEWERDLLEAPFPPAGRVLVGGAGGGREAVALLASGYQVVAFDPAAALVRAGAPTVAAAGGTLVHAAYADLVRAAADASSPLAELLVAPIDGVLLGWGSLSHIIADRDRVALLGALRTIAPRAPVALSFDEPADEDARGSGVARARGVLRRLYRRCGAPGYTGERMRYAPWAGVLRESTVEEVAAVAAAAGYHAAKHGSAPGRMLLVPNA